jgi:hypothetical protein
LVNSSNSSAQTSHSSRTSVENCSNQQSQSSYSRKFSLVAALADRAGMWVAFTLGAVWNFQRVAVSLTARIWPVFYGLDLDKQSGLKQSVAFQAWGSGSDKQPTSLGLFYQDDSQQRWVLRCNDAKTLTISSARSSSPAT